MGTLSLVWYQFKGSTLGTYNTLLSTRTVNKYVSILPDANWWMGAVRVRESIKRWKLEPTREIGNHLSRATQYCINHCPCVVCAIHTNDFACSGSNDFSVGALNVHVYSSSLIKKCNRYRTYPCARYDFLPEVKWCRYLFELFITPERIGKRVLYDLDTWCCRLSNKRNLHDVFGNCTSKSIISC